MFSVAIMCLIRIMLRAKAPRGMSELAFLIAGFMIYNIVTGIMMRCMEKFDSKSAMLAIPQITPLDIIVAKSIFYFMTQLLSLSMLAVIGCFFGFEVTIVDTGLLLLCLLLAFMLGLGLGLCLGMLAVYVPILHVVVPICKRVLFMISGVFFSVSTIAHKLGEYMLYNPILQLIELARSSMYTGYNDTYLNLEYTIEISLILFATGLLLERYIRSRPKV